MVVRTAMKCQRATYDTGERKLPAIGAGIGALTLHYEPKGGRWFAFGSADSTKTAQFLASNASWRVGQTATLREDKQASIRRGFRRTRELIVPLLRDA